MGPDAPGKREGGDGPAPAGGGGTGRDAWLTPATLLVSMLVALGAGLRIMRAWGESLWFDELYMVHASRLPLPDLLAEVPASGHPPLFHLLGHGLFTDGTGELQVRALSLAAGTLLILLVYMLARELLSRTAGFWAAALAALSPPLITMSAEAIDYALAVTLSAAALLLLARAVRRGGTADWAWFTLASVALLYTSGLGLIFLAAAVPFYLVIDKGRRRLRQWSASQALLAASFIPWYLMMRAGPGPERLASAGQLAEGIMRAPMMALKGTASLPLLRTSAAVFLVASLAAAAIFLMSSSVRQALRSRASVALAAMLAITVTASVAAALGIESFEAGKLSIRYYSVAIVPLILLLSLALASAPRWLGVAAGVAVLATMTYVTLLEIDSRTWDYSSLMQVVAENREPGGAIICFPVHHCVVAASFYLDGDPMLLTGGWVTADGQVMFNAEPREVWSGYREDYEEVTLDGDLLEERIGLELDGARQVWLIIGRGHGSIYHDSPEVAAALESGWDREAEWEFDPFRLVLYEHTAGSG